MQVKTSALIIGAMLAVFLNTGCKDSGAGSSSAMNLDSLLEAAKKSGVCIEWGKMTERGDIHDFVHDYVYLDAFGEIPGAYESYYAEIIDCMAAADDCDAWLRCQGMNPDQPCDPETFENSCEGESVVVSCDEISATEGYVSKYDCGSYGFNADSVCMISKNGWATCGVGECSEEDADSSWCEGDILKECGDEVLRTSYDCAEQGLSCFHLSEEVGGGWSSSTFCGTGEDCPENRCRGDEMIICDFIEGSKIMATIDCGSIDPGFTCAVDGEQGYYCGILPNDRECEEGEAFCEGSVANFCFGGKLISTDCSTFLNATCSYEPEYDDSEEYVIRCVSQ